MTNGNSVINLGDLSRPATVLIKKNSAAIGVMYEPIRIKRKASAESEAVKIKQLAKLDMFDEIEQRTVSRLLIEETKKQENIEDITREALNDLKEDARPEDIEDDWIAHFFEKCRIVSDADMQKLWSRVLAGEANNPGHFSRRTVEFIATMDKKDANNFTNLCRYIVTSNGPLLLIPEIESGYFASKGIDFQLLTDMDSIGLITLNALTGFVVQNLPKFLNFYYGPQQIFKVEMANETGNEFVSGKVMLTKLGRELATISGAVTDDTFLLYLKKEYEKSGVKVIF